LLSSDKVWRFCFRKFFIAFQRFAAGFHRAALSNTFLSTVVYFDLTAPQTQLACVTSQIFKRNYQKCLNIRVIPRIFTWYHVNLSREG